MITDLNELAQRVHKANEKWWQHPETKERIERNKGELLMLVITELAEACEGERRGLMDDKLPHRKMAEVECADALIRLLDFAAGFGMSLQDNEFPTTLDCSDNKGEQLFVICNTICQWYFKYDCRWECFPHIVDLIQDYCTKHNYNLMEAFEEKMAYNATRVDHTHEARSQADGKKW